MGETGFMVFPKFRAVPVPLHLVGGTEAQRRDTIPLNNRGLFGTWAFIVGRG